MYYNIKVVCAHTINYCQKLCATFTYLKSQTLQRHRLNAMENAKTKHKYQKTNEYAGSVMCFKPIAISKICLLEMNKAQGNKNRTNEQRAINHKSINWRTCYEQGQVTGISRVYCVHITAVEFYARIIPQCFSNALYFARR